ncbi:MAG: tRNA (adenosine(37)-N6)-dimethylallyltransferase MiaA, partial [Pirellulales bacterium]|nr:tRNA (adenosine(37)-N6)-dimethylallyltransferase MiaA [Pirellulales bacterium]
MDSMALYRGMDIGTAKPTAEQRRAVPHHLIDILEPGEEFSLAQYVAAARQCVEEILGRGRQVLFVGGTPLYLKALLRGIFQGPPADEDFRRQWREKAEQQGPAWLHEQVKKVDPVTAARLHPNDTKRLIRALEVFQKSGTPISQLQRQFDRGRPAESCRVFVLNWPRPELHRRIDRRVEEMFSQGLVEEVRNLLTLGATAGLSSSAEYTVGQANRGTRTTLSKTARQAVGYREVIEHLEGQSDLPATIQSVKLHTRQLAKRQTTWFRSLSECRFVPAEGKSPAALAGEIQEAVLMT